MIQVFIVQHSQIACIVLPSYGNGSVYNFVWTEDKGLTNIICNQDSYNGFQKTCRLINKCIGTMNNVSFK